MIAVNSAFLHPILRMFKDVSCRVNVQHLESACCIDCLVGHGELDQQSSADSDRDSLERQLCRVGSRETRESAPATPLCPRRNIAVGPTSCVLISCREP